MTLAARRPKIVYLNAFNTAIHLLVLALTPVLTASGAFTLTGGMSSARSLHTATLLADGRVLICGGADASLQALGTAEIYDPRTATFSPTGPMGTARFAANATMLPDGRVLIVGGEDRTTYQPPQRSFSIRPPARSLSLDRCLLHASTRR